MIDYEKMYNIMCLAVTDSLDILAKQGDKESINTVRVLLKEGMLKAENIYISSDGNKKIEDF